MFDQNQEKVWIMTVRELNEAYKSAFYYEAKIRAPDGTPRTIAVNSDDMLGILQALNEKFGPDHKIKLGYKIWLNKKTYKLVLDGITL